MVGEGRGVKKGRGKGGKDEEKGESQEKHDSGGAERQR